jgi:hypothetical protein
MGAGTAGGRVRLDWRVAGGSGAAALVIAAMAVSTGSQGAASRSGADLGRSAAVAATPTPTDVGHHPLLPNMDSRKAKGVRIVKNPGAPRHLLFTSTLVNRGVGPLEVVPQPGKVCPTGERDVAQAIYQDKSRDGRYQRLLEHKRVFRQAGCMEFHPSHNHWHVDASARYWLTKPGVTKRIVKHSKVSFCLRDSIRLPGKTRHSFYGACSRDARQGITPGWGDVYQWFLPGQELVLPRHLPKGLYCLHQRADPLDLFRESDETDNDSVRALRIRRTTVSYLPTSRCL